MRRWEWLAHEAKRRKWQRGAELGVKEGRTLFYLLDAVPGLHMIGVDVWRTCSGYEDWDHPAHYRTVMDRAGEYKGRVTILRKLTVLAAREVKDGSLDFVFIDAGHARHAVEADIIAWRPKIREGGLLCGHDGNRAMVSAALDEHVPGWRLVGHENCWAYG